MKGNAKCGNSGRLRRLGVTQGHQRCRQSIEHILIHFNIETMRLSSTVFELQWVICRKSPILTYPTCIWRLRWGWPRSSFAEIFSTRKLECGVICVILSLAVSAEHQLVTDRQTDRQTDTRRQLINALASVARVKTRLSQLSQTNRVTLYVTSTVL